jgi:undecaprenyl-diphosphatase
MLHLATAGAVIVYFFDELYVLFQTVLRKVGRLPVNEKDLMLVKALLIGTIPAVIAGLLLESYMDQVFRSPFIVAGMLALGAFLFMYAEYVYENTLHTGRMDMKTGFKVGLFQVLALIPGMSRSGSTIAGGMILGLSRSDATRFSFLLALPVILGAGCKKLLELVSSPVPVSWMSIGIGAFVAFLVGLAAIHFMLSFIRKHSLWPFIWYRIILAVLIVGVAFFGG